MEDKHRTTKDGQASTFDFGQSDESDIHKKQSRPLIELNIRALSGTVATLGIVFSIIVSSLALFFSLSVRNENAAFLQIDGRNAPNIAIKEGTGKLSVTIKSKRRCNLIVYAFAEYRDFAKSMEFKTQLLMNGSLVSEDSRQPSDSTQKYTNVIIYGVTIKPSGTPLTFEITHSNSTGSEEIGRSKFIIHAVPTD